MKLVKRYLKRVGSKIEPDEIESYFGHGAHVHMGYSTNTDNESSDSLNYACPMKCEGDKTYDHPGNCPVCHMKLMPVNSI